MSFYPAPNPPFDAACLESRNKNPPVIVCGNRVSNPLGVTIRVQNSNSRNSQQSTLVKQNVVLLHVQADDQVGSQGITLLGSLGALAVCHINLHHLSVSNNHLSIRNSSGDPLLEKMATASKLSSLDDGACLTLARSNEKNQTTVVGNTLNDLGGAAKVRNGRLERDDVNTLTSTVDVTLVAGVPKRSGMSEVGSGGKQQLEGKVLRRGRVVRNRVRAVVRGDAGTKLAGSLLFGSVSGEAAGDAGGADAPE
jgi:hypothetical protein